MADDLEQEALPEGFTVIDEKPADDAPPEGFELINEDAPAAASGSATLFQRAPFAPPTAAQLRDRKDAIPEHSAAGRVLSAFGQGWEDGWGSENFGIDRPELREWLEKTGMIGTPGGDKGVLGPITGALQAANEVLIRPFAAAIDVGVRALN
jgi:hypothetical protein